MATLSPRPRPAPFTDSSRAKLRYPAVAVVGRPNVGKSALCNRLSGTRHSLVVDTPGVTLDRIVTPIDLPGARVLLIDTGGLTRARDDLSRAAFAQAATALDECRLVLLVADARAGLTAADGDWARFVRRRGKPVVLAANKAEGRAQAAAADFAELGFESCAVSALRGDGIESLRGALLSALRAADALPSSPAAAPVEEEKPLRVAIVGRPNVGKSTLLNLLCREARATVSDIPGTTRDSIEIEIRRAARAYRIVDTAGLRRNKSAADDVGRIAMDGAKASLARADAAILVIDLADGATRQDRKICALIESRGKPAAVAANKSDLVPAREKRGLLARAIEELRFAAPLRGFALSAASGKAPEDGLFAAVDEAAKSGAAQVPTPRLNRALADIVARNRPPTRGKIRPKFRYAHQGGESPPLFVVHGAALDRVSDDYRRFLARALGREFGLVGVCPRVSFVVGDNPFAPGE